MTDGTEIKNLTEKATGEAADEFVINASGLDRKLGMDGIRITSSQVTDITAFTLGSIPFSDGTSLIEDNSNLFWDDTNNRLGIGITSPLDVLHVVGDFELDHTAAGSDEHALDIEADAAGFGDIKALDVDYVTGAISTGEDEGVLLVNIIENVALGGEIFALEVLTTTVGSTDNIIAVKTGIGIDPINQFSGTFGNAEVILNKTTSVLAELSSGGAGNITVFVDDDDTITIGDANKFEEIEFIVDTGASGAGIKPTFEFSTGTDTWDTFTPTDGTNGFKNTGEVLFDDSDIPGWMTGTGTKFLIRITRTRNELTTKPILDLIQISAVTVFSWDNTGDLIINNMNLAKLNDAGTHFAEDDEINLANGAKIAWTNNAGDAVGSLQVTSGDVFQFNDFPIMTLASVGLIQQNLTRIDEVADNVSLMQWRLRGKDTGGASRVYGEIVLKQRVKTAGAIESDFFFAVGIGTGGNAAKNALEISGQDLIVETQNAFNFGVPSGSKVFLDGGGDTSIREGSTVNTMIFETAGSDQWTILAGGDLEHTSGTDVATVGGIRLGANDAIGFDLDADRMEFSASGGVIFAGLTGTQPGVGGRSGWTYFDNNTVMDFNLFIETGGGSSPELRMQPAGGTLGETATQWVSEVGATDDTGTRAMSEFMSRRVGAVITTRPLFEWFNHTTSVGKIDVNGIWRIPVPEHVTILADSVSVVWSNQPAALTEFKGNTECRVKVDTVGHVQCRLVVNVITVGNTGATMHPEYDAGSGFLELADTANAMDVAIDATGLIDSGFVDIDALAKADVTIRIVGEGGDAMVDPDFTMIHLEFR